MMKEERILRAMTEIDPRLILAHDPARTEDASARRRRPLRTVLIAAAVIALLAAAALALNVFGLRSLLLPAPKDAPDAAHISLSGYMDTPESRALAEWTAFLDAYDPDRSILSSVGDGVLDESLARYSLYLVYSPAMAEELERIAAKYGLKLHAALYDVDRHPEPTKEIDGFLGTTSGEPLYMYEDGTFLVDNGWVKLPEFGAMDFQLMRAVRGTFHEVTLFLGELSDYREWPYTTAKGVPVTLALGPTRALIFADLGDCFVTVNGLIGADNGMTAERLQALADCFDLARLSPVIAPKPAAEPEPLLPAAERTDAVKTYVAVLRNLLYNALLPDGRATGLPRGDAGATQFAIHDVDMDGKEELILLYDPGAVADMAGYVIAFDETYTGDAAPIRILAQDFPAFTFYTGKYMTVDRSHNQGLSGSVLWPYTLYHYEGLFVADADVDAWDGTAWATDWDGNPFPEELAGGEKVLYYVNFRYPSGVELSGEHVWSKAEYEAWLSELEMGEKIEVSYTALTEDALAALGG